MTSSGDGRADTWLACDWLPGTRLRWVWTGILRDEPRTAELQTPACVRRAVPWTAWSPSRAAVVRLGGRSFTSRRVSRSDWPGIASMFGADWPAPPAHRRPDPDQAQAGTPEEDDSGQYLPHVLLVLVDEHGVPVLSTGGRNFNHSAGAYVRVTDGRWLQFPVWGHSREGAIMTALDQAGSKIALYRMVRANSAPLATDRDHHPPRSAAHR